MNTNSLFDNDQGEFLPMLDATVFLANNIEFNLSHEKLLTALIDVTPWRCEEIVMWGKRMQQPRLSAWHGDSQSHYSYSGIHLTPLPWTSLLIHIKHKIESIANSQFNSVLLNYYRNNLDSMGMHSDDEKELGKRPVIASFSLGAERTLIFKHKQKKHHTVKIPLQSGSLLIMSGETQKYWSHGISKEKKPCGPRVNLTYRKITQTNHNL